MGHDKLHVSEHSYGQPDAISPANIGQYGVAALDSGGKVPVEKLPLTSLIFDGDWNANTNSPTLADNTGVLNHFRQVTVAGTQDLGSGSITFGVGDWVVHNGTRYYKFDNPNSVVSVDGATGVVSLSSTYEAKNTNIQAHVTGSGSPHTPVGIGAEPAFSKNTAFNKNFGTSAGDVCQGNDARLSDARTPTSHTHGNLTNDGKVGSTANLPLKTGTAGAVEAGAFGTGATDFCVGNDARLSDGRTDANAIHKATASEISAITLKATPVSADMLLIEDSADSNNKKRITVGTLPGGVDSTAIHKATAAEISAMTEKTAPVDNDLVVIEDSADSNNKKKVLVKNLAGKGCRHITAGACLGVSSSWNLASNFMYISITSGGQIIANDHIAGDYRSGLTIRLRVKRTGTVNTPTITMYKNGVADATINASAITLGTSWASVSFTPGSSYAADDDITFEITRGTGAGTLELQYIDVDWDRKVG